MGGGGAEEEKEENPVTGSGRAKRSLSRQAHLVAVALASFAGGDPCYPGRATIAARAGIALPECNAGLDELERSRDLEIRRPGPGAPRRSSTYVLSPRLRAYLGCEPYQLELPIPSVSAPGADHANVVPAVADPAGDSVVSSPAAEAPVDPVVEPEMAPRDAVPGAAEAELVEPEAEPVAPAVNPRRQEAERRRRQALYLRADQVHCPRHELGILDAIPERAWGRVVGYLFPTAEALARAGTAPPPPPARKTEPVKGDLGKGLALLDHLGLSPELLAALRSGTAVS